MYAMKLFRLQIYRVVQKNGYQVLFLGQLR